MNSIINFYRSFYIKKAAKLGFLIVNCQLLMPIVNGQWLIEIVNE